VQYFLKVRIVNYSNIPELIFN